MNKDNVVEFKSKEPVWDGRIYFYAAKYDLTGPECEDGFIDDHSEAVEVLWQYPPSDGWVVLFEPFVIDPNDIKEEDLD